jgi:hypothetical protein
LAGAGIGGTSLGTGLNTDLSADLGTGAIKDAQAVLGATALKGIGEFP